MRGIVNPGILCYNGSIKLVYERKSAMQRLFPTHFIRESSPAPALWTLTTLDDGGLTAPMKALVPSAWESIPALHNYRGRAAYECRLSCGGNMRFRFGGVSFRAKVYLDDALLAEHYNAFTAFEAVAPDVPYGEHTLRVEVDNRFGEDSALHVPNDYYSYGGVTRPVEVEYLGDAYVRQLHVTPIRAAEGWQAKVEAVIASLSSAPLTCDVRLEAADSEVCVEGVELAPHGETVVIRVIDCPDVQPWCVDSPVLYSASAVIEAEGEPVDDLRDRFGFRTVEVRGKDILFNGEKLIIKGFNRHEEYGPFACAIPVEAMAHDIHLMKDMHCNAVRTCHYPNDPRFLDLCDEMGLLVWEESHARGLSEKQMRNPNFMPQNLDCTREMVAQHYNHPAIFIWGCLNECADDCDYGADCFRQTYRLLDELDESRPMTAALLERPGSRVFADSDVVSINIYPQWYHNTPVKTCMESKLQEIKLGGGGDKPLIVSEIGGGAVYGCHDPLGESKWSEERQCTILREQIEAVLSHPDCSGIFIWQLADVRVVEEWAMGRPRTHNNKGVVNEYRQPKMAYKLVRELFS